MLGDLRGKVALVTGGTRGIGLAIARTLSGLGTRVALTGTRADAAGDAAATIQGQSGSEVAGFELQLAASDSVSGTVEQVTSRFGTIDVLVNSAAIVRDDLLIRMSDEDWDDVMNVNLKGVFRLTRAVLRGMLRRRHGSIVNIGSVVGLSGNPGQANYAAAKAGLMGFTRTVAREYAGKGIRANVVSPGFIETDMTRTLSSEQQASIRARIPLDRFGDPADVASMVAFLASECSSYITGQIFRVDGGLSM